MFMDQAHITVILALVNFCSMPTRKPKFILKIAIAYKPSLNAFKCVIL